MEENLKDDPDDYLLIALYTNTRSKKAFTLVTLRKEINSNDGNEIKWVLSPYE